MFINLIFLDTFDSEFKGKTYKIFRFMDPNSLQVLSGTDLKGAYEVYKIYKCKVEYTHNKLKVVDVQ